ncbi:MAG: hypothetical protein JXR03_05340 [Cyclobacteriaceae bacterium]
MKKQIFYIILSMLTFFGCIESDIVDDFSADQVEQILTAGDIKTWYRSELIVDGVRQPIETCQDTVKWTFEVISTDSIAAYELSFDNICTLYDTTFLGAFSPSKFGEIFTDSLKFEGGNKTFMRPNYIRSKVFSVRYTENDMEITASFEETRSDILSRQVGYFLTNGLSVGDTQSWSLTSLSIDGDSQPFRDCSDTLIFQFERQNIGVALKELETDTLSNCGTYISSDIGSVSVPENTLEGFFENQFLIEGDEINEMTISSFDQKGFSASYLRNQVEHIATYQVLD